MLTDRYLATEEKPVLSDTLCIAIASIARKAPFMAPEWMERGAEIDGFRMF